MREFLSASRHFPLRKHGRGDERTPPEFKAEPHTDPHRRGPHGAPHGAWSPTNRPEQRLNRSERSKEQRDLGALARAVALLVLLLDERGRIGHRQEQRRGDEDLHQDNTRGFEHG